MRMNEGVEWAVHCCVNLSWMRSDEAVTAARLAAFYDLPTAYLNKQLQALARAGILGSAPGPRGGFRLARPAERITLMDIVAAIEGPDEAFRCAEIRRRGPNAAWAAADPAPCLVDEAMRAAELSWRKELAGRTIAELRDQVAARAPQHPQRVRDWYAHGRS